MRKIRLVLLGVLCAGLLVCGIGTGVTLAEVSTFSYGGQQLLESAQSRTQSLTVTLDLPECTVYLEDVPYGWGSDNRHPRRNPASGRHIRLGRAGACGLDRLLGGGKSGVGPCELAGHR